MNGKDTVNSNTYQQINIQQQQEMQNDKSPIQQNQSKDGLNVMSTNTNVDNNNQQPLNGRNSENSDQNDFNENHQEIKTTNSSAPQDVNQPTTGNIKLPAISNPNEINKNQQPVKRIDITSQKHLNRNNLPNVGRVPIPQVTQPNSANSIQTNKSKSMNYVNNNKATIKNQPTETPELKSNGDMTVKDTGTVVNTENPENTLPDEFNKNYNQLSEYFDDYNNITHNIRGSDLKNIKKLVSQITNELSSTKDAKTRSCIITKLKQLTINDTRTTDTKLDKFFKDIVSELTNVCQVNDPNASLDDKITTFQAIYGDKFNEYQTIMEKGLQDCKKKLDTLKSNQSTTNQTSTSTAFQETRESLRQVSNIMIDSGNNLKNQIILFFASIMDIFHIELDSEKVKMARLQQNMLLAVDNVMADFQKSVMNIANEYSQQLSDLFLNTLKQYAQFSKTGNCNVGSWFYAISPDIFNVLSNNQQNLSHLDINENFTSLTKEDIEAFIQDVRQRYYDINYKAEDYNQSVTITQPDTAKINQNETNTENVSKPSLYEIVHEGGVDHYMNSPWCVLTNLAAARAGILANSDLDGLEINTSNISYTEVKTKL